MIAWTRLRSLHTAQGWGDENMRKNNDKRYEQAIFWLDVALQAGMKMPPCLVGALDSHLGRSHRAIQGPLVRHGLVRSFHILWGSIL